MPKLKVGDQVERLLAGTLPMKLFVTSVTDTVVTCGLTPDSTWGWDFDPKTGAEIDEDLGWGPPPLRTGSFIGDPIVIN